MSNKGMIDMRLISSSLELGTDGIWYSRDSQQVSYPREGNEDCFAVEDDSFWFSHRNRCIVSLVGSYPPRDNGPIFDIGGGNGFVSKGLSKAGFETVLLEPGVSGARNAKSRGLNNIICATTETAGLASGSLSAVGLFDVIEHIDEDRVFLERVGELLKKEGRLYATVPSYSFLWSEEDVFAGHYRRYSLTEISDVIQRAGFKVEFSSYIFRFLPIPVFLFRTLPFRLGLSHPESTAKKASGDHATKSGVFSKLLNFTLRPEISNLQNKKKMRFGGSCLIVAKRI